MSLEIGSRIALKQGGRDLSYIACRSHYTDVYAGKKGRIIRFTADGSKAGIEFDTPVFLNQQNQVSKHNNGCHGTGKKDYCWYTPVEFVQLDLTDDDLHWL